jgi:hypothetical protein
MRFHDKAAAVAASARQTGRQACGEWSMEAYLGQQAGVHTRGSVHCPVS